MTNSSQPSPSNGGLLSEVLAMVPEKYRNQVSWGDRGDGQHWHARVGPIDTIGHGGPYRTAGQAIAAAAQLAAKLP